MLNMNAEEKRHQRYRNILSDLEQASRQHAATKVETQDRQVDRAEAIVAISRLGVPRSTVARLTGLTRGRVQQILDQAGEAGASGEDWDDPELRRLVEEAVADRPLPSVGIGVRRESTSGPHLGRGAGIAIPLSGDLEKDRDELIAWAEKLLDNVRSGKQDDLLTLTDEELALVRGDPIDA